MAEEPRIARRLLATHQLPGTLHPVAARVLAARGVIAAEELELELKHLHPPAALRGIDAAADRVIDAILQQRRIVIAGDYDADGATGVALALIGLKLLGAEAPGYVVPNRFTMGYGLSPALAEMAAQQGAKLLITVDNGIASHAGVDAARSLGMQVIVTDHHLPSASLPAADALVNPNQPGCAFPSRHLAGVGVMFYLLLHVRARMRARGLFADGTGPNLADLLDLVAVGTVADLVRLDRNNRILVARGLGRIRAGRARPGLRALLQVAGRQEASLTATDLGFVLGPRINAAGRLEDIRIGIRCLLAEDPDEARSLAAELDRINRQRRDMQSQMNDSALDQLEERSDRDGVGLVLYDSDWHEGIVGLVASKMKEHAHRPAIAFAPAQEPGLLKGSARSIPGLHLRDALADVDARHPGLILRFGGHAMAAGLSLRETDLARFRSAFDAACRARLLPAQLEQVLETDGPLSKDELDLSTALALDAAGPWGQGMPEPQFDDVFEVSEARTVGSDQSHVRYRLRSLDGRTLVAVDFGGAGRMCLRGRVRLVYALAINRWQGSESLELRIQHLRPA
ncbi:MAG: single-stranded-DNA-specific exonuclease RecJ [Panacagrimonas sp.]